MSVLSEHPHCRSSCRSRCTVRATSSMRSPKCRWLAWALRCSPCALKCLVTSHTWARTPPVPDDKLFLLLWQYDELVATGQANSLSPSDLQLRILVKGKVKSLAKKSDRSSTASARLLASLRRSSASRSSRPSQCRTSRPSEASERQASQASQRVSVRSSRPSHTSSSGSDQLHGQRATEVEGASSSDGVVMLSSVEIFRPRSDSLDAGRFRSRLSSFGGGSFRQRLDSVEHIDVLAEMVSRR